MRTCCPLFVILGSHVSDETSMRRKSEDENSYLLRYDLNENPCTPAMIWFGSAWDCIIREFCIDL